MSNEQNKKVEKKEKNKGEHKGTQGQASSGPAINAKPMPKGQPVRGKAKPAKPIPKLPQSKAKARQAVPAPKIQAKPVVAAKPEPEVQQTIQTPPPVIPEPPVAEAGGHGHKGWKVAGLVAAMAVVVAGCAYGAATYYYSDKFFEGTKINGIDCSGLTIAQAEQKIRDQVEEYSINVVARNVEPQQIDGEDIDYAYVPDGSVGQALEDQVPYEWVKGFFGGKKVKANTHISYSQEKLEQSLGTLECAKPENQVAPENAYVAFTDTQFEIIPETGGSTLDTGAALNTLKEAVNESASEVNFDEADTYTKAAVRSDDPGLAANLASCNAYAKASITYTFGEETQVLDGNTIKNWLKFDEKGQFVKDDAAFRQHVTEYVAQMAAERDTVGKERNFHTTSGRDIVVGGGNYGWQINQSAEVAQLLSEIQAGQQVTREPLYSVTGAQHGADDIGDTYIEVDLSSQYMWFYRDGAVIFESEFVSGNMSYSDRVTPTGVCHLYYKQRNQVLRGAKRPDGTYEYESPVDYWMPFNGGVGFHDANWRGTFGGDIYLTSGSHGCINMPPSKAAVLYDLIDTSVPIVAFY